MEYRKRVGRDDPDAVGMGMGDWKVWKTSEDVVRKMRGIIDLAVAAANSANAQGINDHFSQRR